jgi:hypothetical protein
MPSFQPPVWLISPAEPNTYDAGCISERGVVARRTIMITGSDISVSSVCDQREIKPTKRGSQIDKYKTCGQPRKPSSRKAVL